MFKKERLSGYILGLLSTVFGNWVLSGMILQFNYGVVYDNFYSLTLIELAVFLPFYFIIGWLIINICKPKKIWDMTFLGILSSIFLLYPFSFLDITSVTLSDIFMEIWLYSPSWASIIVFSIIGFISPRSNSRHPVRRDKSVRNWR